MPTLVEDPISAPADQVPAIRALEAVLQGGGVFEVVTADAAQQNLRVPAAVFEVLKRVVQEVAGGNAVLIAPVHQQLTTQAAAELLNMSRPHLVKLLEEGTSV